MGSQAKNVYQFKGSKPMGEGNGFVLMYQSIDTQPWSADPFCMLVAPFLIRKAAYSPHERQYGKHTIELQIGQYVTTLLNLAKSSALYGFYTKSKNPDEAAKSAVKRVLKILSEDGFLECKTIGKGKDQCTVITLKNWANYQAKNVSVLKPIREPLKKPIETQSQQGVEGNSKPNLEPKPSPNTNKGSKQQELVSKDTCQNSDEFSHAEASPKPVKQDHTPYAKIIDLYHEILPMFNNVRQYESLKANIKQRHFKLKTLDGWERYFNYIKNNCTWMYSGDYGSASKLSYIVNKANFEDIVNGGKDDRK